MKLENFDAEEVTHTLPGDVYTGDYRLVQLPASELTTAATLAGVSVVRVTTASQAKLKAAPFILAHNYPKPAELASYLNQLKMPQREDLLVVLRAGALPFTKLTDLSENAQDFKLNHFGAWVLDMPKARGQKLVAVLQPTSAAIKPVAASVVVSALGTSPAISKPVPPITASMDSKAELGREYELCFKVDVEFGGKKWETTIGLNTCRDGKSRGIVKAISKDAVRKPRTSILYTWPRLDGKPPVRERISAPITENRVAEWAEAEKFLDATFRAHAIKLAKETNLGHASGGGKGVSGAYISQLIKEGHIRLPHPFTQGDDTKDIRAGSLVNAAKITDAPKRAALTLAIEHVNNLAKTYHGDIEHFKPWLNEEIKKATIPVLMD